MLLYANGTNFSQLNNPPGSSSVQWLVNATQTKPTELQISKAEAAKGGSFVNSERCPKRARVRRRVRPAAV